MKKLNLPKTKDVKNVTYIDDVYHIKLNRDEVLERIRFLNLSLSRGNVPEELQKRERAMIKQLLKFINETS